MGQIDIQRDLALVVLFVEIFLIGRLIVRGLARRYLFFVLYLASDAAWGVILMQIDYRTPAYATCYRMYLLMLAVLRIAVTAELFELICSHFRTIGNFRFGMAGVLVALSGLLSLVYFSPDLRVQHSWPQTMAVLIERYETVTLSVGLLLTRFTLHHFLLVRPPIRPNVTAHWALLTTYFGVAGAFTSVMLVFRGGKEIGVPLSMALLTADLMCLLGWISSLTTKGELVPPSWSEAGKARREEINQRVRELVERTRDELLNRGD